MKFCICSFINIYILSIYFKEIFFSFKKKINFNITKQNLTKLKKSN